MIKPTLAKPFNGQDVTGWLMSEKLDGVRAIWNGQELLSRTGKTFVLPSDWRDSLPDGVILDGELFEGRGLFQSTVGKVRRKTNVDWTGIKYMIFDCVRAGDYHTRLAYLKSLDLPEFCSIVDQCECQGLDHLEQFERELIGQGAEGVMVRNPVAEYAHKRTADLLKVKRFIDAEAIVTGFTEGAGKASIGFGAIICNWQGKQIKIGTGFSDELRREGIEPGSLVTFRYFELTNEGMPRFPAFVAARNYE